MIRFITGPLGSGKTIFAVREMIQAKADGRIIYTNVGWKKEPPGPGEIRPLPEDGIENFHKHIVGGSKERPTYVVLDEAHLYWNARDFAKTKRDSGDMLTFLTMSRRQGVDVDIISQAEANVDAQFRRLATWIIRVKNFKDHPVFSWWELLKTIHVVRFFDAADPKSLHRLFFFRRKPSLWDYYDTTEMIRSEEIPKEIKDLPPPKKSRKGLLVVAALVLGLGFTWWRGNSMLSTNRPPAAAVASHVGASALGSSPATEVKALPPRELYAQAKRDLQWLVGVVNVQPGRWVYLTTPVGYRYVYKGDQLFGARVRFVGLGRGRGGASLMLDDGRKLLLMSANDYRLVRSTVPVESGPNGTP